MPGGNAALVRAFEAITQLLRKRPRKRERHFMILRLAEYAVAVAGQDYLRLAALHRFNHFVGAIGAA